MAEPSLQKSVEQINRRPWREHYGVHPAAEVFPLLSHEELEAMAADMKRHGIRRAPVLLRRSDAPSGYDVVDGRGRLTAIQLAGLPLFDANGTSTFNTHVLADDEDPYDASIAANVLRRHLSKEERDEAMLKMVALRPELSDRQIAKKFGVDHKTIGAVRKKGIATGEVSPVDRTVGADGKSRPVKRKPSENLPRTDKREMPAPVKAQRLFDKLSRLPPEDGVVEMVDLPLDQRAAFFAMLPASQRVKWEVELAEHEAWLVEQYAEGLAAGQLTRQLISLSPEARGVFLAGLTSTTVNSLLTGQPATTRAQWEADLGAALAEWPALDRGKEISALARKFLDKHDDEETIIDYIVELAVGIDAVEPLRQVIGLLQEQLTDCERVEEQAAGGPRRLRFAITAPGTHGPLTVAAADAAELARNFVAKLTPGGAAEFIAAIRNIRQDTAEQGSEATRL
jgi:ParB-like chromosome segregation protein Spo0J